MSKRVYKRSLRVAILTVLLLAVFLFTSCTDLLPTASKAAVTIDEFMVKRENQNGAEQTLSSMPAMMGVPKRVSGDVIITEEETDDIPITRVYNLTNGKLLRIVSDGCPVGFVSDYLDYPENASGVFYVNHYNIMYICNSDGEEAISTYHDIEHPTEKGNELLPEPIFEDSLNGFSYNGVEYFVRDGAVVYEEASPLESDYFSASVLYKERYYFISDLLVFVFDENGTLLYEYHLPSYAQNANIYVLQSGNVFVQYTYKTFEDEEYDFVWNSEKHKIVSILAEVEKGRETFPRLSFLVTDLRNDFTDEDFYERYTEKVSNMALVIHIDNKRIDANMPAHYTVLSNALLELYSLFDVVTGAESITRISYDRYLVVTAAGGILVAGDGTHIGQVNNYRCITEKFILTSGAIYDHDLNVLMDLIAEDYTYYASVGDNIVLSRVDGETVGLYLFSGGTPVYLANALDFYLCFEGYAIKSEEGYVYYDENGNLLLTVAGEIVWIYEKTEKALCTRVGYLIAQDGKVNYYRLQFKPVNTIE